MKKLFLIATIFTVILYNLIAQRTDQYRPRQNTPGRYPVIIRNPLNAYGTNPVTSTKASADLFINFENTGINRAANVADLVSATSSNGNYGFYGLNPSPATNCYFTNDVTFPLIAPLYVNGVLQNLQSAQSSMMFYLAGNSFSDFRFTNNVGGQSNMCVGFFFQIYGNSSLGDFSDLVQMDGGGEYAVAGLTFDNPPTIKLHSNTNFGASSATHPIQTNFIYYVEMSWMTNMGTKGMSYLSLRNGTNGALIMSTNIGHGSPRLVDYTRFGKENHAFTDVVKVRIDNVNFRFNSRTVTNYIWQ